MNLSVNFSAGVNRPLNFSARIQTGSGGRAADSRSDDPGSFPFGQKCMKIVLCFAKSKTSNSLQVVMAQLAEQLLPTPEAPCSSPAYGNATHF